MNRLRNITALLLVFQFLPGAVELVDTVVHYVEYNHLDLSHSHHHHHENPHEGLTHTCSTSCSCSPGVFLITLNNAEFTRSSTTHLHFTRRDNRPLPSGYFTALFRPPCTV